MERRKNKIYGFCNSVHEQTKRDTRKIQSPQMSNIAYLHNPKELEQSWKETNKFPEQP